MGRFKAIVPFFLAIVVALVASFAIYQWMQRRSEVPRASVPLVEHKESVALSSADFPWGTKLTAEMIKMASLPKEHIPAGYFSDRSALEGRVVIAPLKQNEPIIESKLASTDITTGGVAAVVTRGKRALAVAGDKVLGLSGFIQPGNRVDVLVTLGNPKNERDHITKVVLEDILVLASGPQVQHSTEGKPAPVDVFTLEVTPEEGERLSLAATQGRLHFALRNVLDKEVVYTMGATISDALDAYRPRLQLVKEQVVQTPANVMESSRRVFEVQTIRGTKVGKQAF